MVKTCNMDAKYSLRVLFTIQLLFLCGSQLVSTETTAPPTTCRQRPAVYLKSKYKVYYSNNSMISISDIGEGDDALLCITDLKKCCRRNQTLSSFGVLGDWFYPDGVRIVSDDMFYRNRNQSVVRLHRREDTTAPTGQFCCKVPDATYKVVTICIDVIMSNSNESENISSQTVVPEDEYCKQTLTISGAAAGAAAVFIIIAIAVIIIIMRIILQRRNKAAMLHQESTFQSPGIYSEVQNVIEMKQQKMPVIIEFPSDVAVIEGDGVYFKIKVNGKSQPTVAWYHDGELVRADYIHEIEADGSLAIPSTELKHSGVYKAVVANKHGSEEREVKLAVIKEEDYINSDALESTVSTQPIPVLEFGKYVAELHTDSNSNQPFIKLYKSLDSGDKDHTTNYATDPRRKALNRFNNIVVYDDNRIVLKPIPNCMGDYINACYIDGYSVPDKFIATQGPLPTTFVDFWQLIWQEHPPIIVMVTNIMEGNHIKCQQYWPENGKKDFGPFQVTITDKQVFADYTIRTFSVSLDLSGHSHIVTQYHFTAWPDHGVPEYATSVLAFHRRVKAQYNPSKGPVLVHCSAGIGRTGTFIAIDNILEQLEKEKIVDVPGVIIKMRQRRIKMVQTPEQFIFIHDAILESVTCGDTQISAINLRLAVTKMKKNNGFQYQMKILEQVSPKLNEIQCTTALTYPERNRNNNFLPDDHWRVFLKGEQPDYIHAVNVNGYKQKKAFIIAQGPMKSTVRNFWKMICDHKIAVIVMLSDLMEGGHEASARYWPSSGICQYGEYIVDLLGEEKLQGFIIRNLSVMDIKIQKASYVTQLHVTNWKANGQCSNLKSIIDVVKEMTKVQIRSGNKPIVAHCSDTVTRSGMFCAIATTIERCKTEGVVDVFQVVKALRVQKPGAVPTVEDFRLIFDAILMFLESFDTYANFQNI